MQRFPSDAPAWPHRRKQLRLRRFQKTGSRGQKRSMLFMRALEISSRPVNQFGLPKRLMRLAAETRGLRLFGIRSDTSFNLLPSLRAVGKLSCKKGYLPAIMVYSMREDFFPPPPIRHL